MAITVLDVDTSVTNTTGYTAAAGSDRCVVWGVSSGNTSHTTDAMSIGGDALTYIVSSASANAIQSALGRAMESVVSTWSGAETASITWNTAPGSHFGAALTLGGVDQSSPVLDSKVGVTASSTSLALAAVNVADGGIVIVEIGAGQNLTGPAGYTQVFNNTGASNPKSAMYYKLITADGTETPTFTTGVATIGRIAVLSLSPAAAAGVAGDLVATEATDAARALANATLPAPVLIDALSDESEWTAEWGSGGAWASHANAATNLAVQGPAGNNWIGVFTGFGYYTGSETGGRITKTITPVDLSAAKNVAISYALSTLASTESNPARLYNIQMYLGSDGDGSFDNSVVADFDLGADSAENSSIANRLIQQAILDKPDFATHAGAFDWSSVSDIRIVIYGSNGTALAAAGTNAVRVYFNGLYSNVWSRPVVVFTHDDGPDGVYNYAFSRYAAKGWKTTQFIFPEGIDTSTKMTLAECSEMYGAGHDFGLHSTYSGAVLDTMTGAEIDADLANGLAYLETNGFTRAKHIASWPQGVFVDSSNVPVFDRFADQGVVVARGVRRNYQQVDIGAWSAFDNYATGKNIKAMHLRWMDVQSDRLPNDVLPAALSRLIKYGGVLVLGLHNVVSTGATGTAINLSDFEDTLELIAGYEADGLVTVQRLSDLFPGTDTGAATDEQPTGGYLAENMAAADRQRRRYLRELEEEAERERELEELANRVEAQLVAEGTLDPVDADLLRLRGMAAPYFDDLPNRARRALAYAERAQTAAATQLALREMARVQEDEEYAVLLVLAMDS